MSLILMGEGCHTGGVLDGKGKAFLDGLIPVQEPKLANAAPCNSWEDRSSKEGMVIAGDEGDRD